MLTNVTSQCSDCAWKSLPVAFESTARKLNRFHLKSNHPEVYYKQTKKESTLLSPFQELELWLYTDRRIYGL